MKPVPHLSFPLAHALNQYWDVGCKTFTRHELLAYGERDWKRITYFLQEWETRGLIEILQPLEGAGDSAVIVRMLHRIHAPRPQGATLQAKSLVDGSK